jgi:hypothetical protein
LAAFVANSCPESEEPRWPDDHRLRDLTISAMPAAGLVQSCCTVGLKEPEPRTVNPNGSTRDASLVYPCFRRGPRRDHMRRYEHRPGTHIRGRTRAGRNHYYGTSGPKNAFHGHRSDGIPQ